MYNIIDDRIRNPKSGSYTSKIAADESKIKNKIKEECLEILDYKGKIILYEISDLFYFVCLMAKEWMSKILKMSCGDEDERNR